jgi:hypothetical protein
MDFEPRKRGSKIMSLARINHTASLACALDAAAILGVDREDARLWRGVPNARTLLEDVMLGRTLRERKQAAQTFCLALEKALAEQGASL